MIRLSLIAIVLFLSSFLPLCEGEGTNPFADNDTTYKEPLPNPDDIVNVEIYPERIACDSVIYPPWQEEWGSQASAWVKVLIGPSGDILGVLIWKSTGFQELDEAAMQHAVTCTFTPAYRDGHPVAVWAVFTVTFSRDI